MTHAVPSTNWQCDRGFAWTFSYHTTTNIWFISFGLWNHCWISRSKLFNLDKHLTRSRKSIRLVFHQTVQCAELNQRPTMDDGVRPAGALETADLWPRRRSYTLNQDSAAETNIPPDSADVSNFSLLRSYYALTCGGGSGGVCWGLMLASLVAQHELRTTRHSCCCWNKLLSSSLCKSILDRICTKGTGRSESTVPLNIPYNLIAFS